MTIRRPIREKVLRASAWIGLAKLITNIATLGSTFVLARLLTPDDFGVVALALSIVTIVAAATELSASHAIVAIRSVEADHFDTAWTINLARGFVVVLVMLGLAPVASSLTDEPRLAEIIAAMAVVQFLSSLRSPRIAALEKELYFRHALLIALFSNLVTATCSISLAIYLDNYWSIVGGMLAGQSTTIILSYILAPYRPRISFKRVAELWRFSIWLTLSEFAIALNYRLDQVVVGSTLNLTSLGYYTLGGRLAQIPGRELLGPITESLFPAFSQVGEGSPGLISAYRRSQTLVTFIALPVGFVTSLLAEPLVVVFLGPNWNGAVMVVQVVAAVTALETLGSLVEPLAKAKQETRLVFFRNIQKLSMRMPLIIGGLYFGGFAGLVWMRGLAGLLSVFIDMMMVRAAVGISVGAQFRANWRTLLSGTVMALAVWQASRAFPPLTTVPAALLELIVLGGLGVTIYALTSALLWLVVGRPGGPEAEVLTLARSAFSWLLRRPARLEH